MHTETTEIGPHQFFGITDQADTPAPVRVAMFNLAHAPINTGSAVLNIQTCRIGQGAGTQLAIDQLGQPSTKQIFGRFLTMSLSVIPEGATRDNAAGGLFKAASCPPIGAYCTITGAPVMGYGPFDSGDNVGGGAFNSANWQVLNSNLNTNAGAGATVDLELIQYTAINQRPY